MDPRSSFGEAEQFLNVDPGWLATAWSLLLVVGVPVLLFVEQAAPRRAPSLHAWRRWIGNLALSGSCWWLGVKTMLLGMVVVGWWSDAELTGLLNRVPLPPGLSLVSALLLVDLSEYVIHRAYHSVPVLWRLHRVHHSDPQVDLTTALRQHPLTVLVDVPARLLL